MKHLLLTCILLLPTHVAGSEWRGAGVPATTSYFAGPMAIESDGVGGAYMALQCLSEGASYGAIRAQRVDSTGAVLWGSDGVFVSNPLAQVNSPALVSAESGGMYVLWIESVAATRELWVQRLDPNGTLAWPTGAVRLARFVSGYEVQAMLDPSGGLVVAWPDFRNSRISFYAQRVTSEGETLWGTDGAMVGPEMVGTVGLAMVTDGTTTYLAYQGSQCCIQNDARIFLQKVDAAGQRLWGYYGLEVAFVGYVSAPRMAAALGTGGDVYVAWEATVGGRQSAVVQRVNADGAIRWPTAVAVCDGDWHRVQPVIHADEAGGLVAAWTDRRRNEHSMDVAVQRLDSLGVRLWGAAGKVISAEEGQQTDPVVDVREDGSILVAWRETLAEGMTVAMQEFDGYGQERWESGARRLRTDAVAMGIQLDALGGMLAVWGGARYGYPRAMVGRVRPDGEPGFADNLTPRIARVVDEPNDEGGWVRVEVAAPRFDSPGGDPPVESYNVWRRLSPAEQLAASSTSGANVVVSDGSELPPGTWISIGQHQAAGLENLAILVPTRADSGEVGLAVEEYVVTAHPRDWTGFYSSESVSGYSVDNLAPVAPHGFMATMGVGAVYLSWSPNQERDVSHYRLYRGATVDFVPSESNLLTATAQREAIDPDGSSGAIYKVSAVDRHGNEGPPATATLSGPTGTLASLVSVDSDPSQVRLVWHVPTGQVVDVFRGTTVDGWARVGTLAPDGNNYVTFVDEGLAAGRYGYRLRSASLDIQLSADVWVEVASAELALSILSNPTAGLPLRVGLVLPHLHAVTVEMIDVAGRVVDERRFESPGPGRLTVTLGEGRRVAPGMYLVRVRQGTEQRTARAIILR